MENEIPLYRSRKYKFCEINKGVIKYLVFYKRLILAILAFKIEYHSLFYLTINNSLLDTSIFLSRIGHLEFFLTRYNFHIIFLCSHEMVFKKNWASFFFHISQFQSVLPFLTNKEQKNGSNQWVDASQKKVKSAAALTWILHYFNELGGGFFFFQMVAFFFL